MSLEQLMDYQEIDLKPWTRLLGSGGRVALVIVPLDLERQAAAGLAEEMAAVQFLSPGEQQQLKSYSFRKRRLQWLGGRLAAKLAASKILSRGQGAEPSFPWHHLQVAAESSGRPYLQWCDGAPHLTALPDISISHSGPVACALAVAPPTRCGVDIQIITEATVRVRERFAALSELEILEALVPSEPLPNRLTLLWAAKETIRKATGSGPLPGFLELSLTNATPGPGRQGLVFVFNCQPVPQNAAVHQTWRSGTVEVAVMIRGDAALAFVLL